MKMTPDRPPALLQFAALVATTAILCVLGEIARNCMEGIGLL